MEAIPQPKPVQHEEVVTPPLARLRVRRSGFYFGQVEGGSFFSLPPLPDRYWGPPSLLAKEYREYLLGSKAALRAADQSSTSGAEVNNVWLYIHDSILLHGLLVIK